MLLNLIFLGRHASFGAQDCSQFMPLCLKARPCTCRPPAGNFLGQAHNCSRTRPHHPHFPGSRNRVRNDWKIDSATENAPLDMYDTTIMLNREGSGGRE